MAASFPNAKKTFSQIVNGITKLVAAIFNVNYDETEAIETFIGPTGGGAQSYSESLTNLLYNYRYKCNVEYKGVEDIYVRAGEIMLTDAAGNRRLRRNTADLTLDWDDLDGGAEANSVTYLVYAVGDDAETTFDAVISTGVTAPAGYTFFKKLGSFYNDTDILKYSIANFGFGFSGQDNIRAGETGALALGDNTVKFKSAFADANYMLTLSPPIEDNTYHAYWKIKSQAADGFVICVATNDIPNMYYKAEKCIP